ncbi:MAG: hypothetical protein C0467_03620 [Planctomycetaceae bacterium]|nr:hypothetical protein [Planctomycetaceae bacterium]
MAEEDPMTVFVAPSLPLAEAAVKLLAGEGIDAEVIVPPPKAESQLITGVTDMVEPDEFHIRILDAAKVDDANKFLGSVIATAKLQAIRDRRANRTGTISAVCEDCGRASDWPAIAMGTTENCPHCGGYMDIPDPDEDWSEMDFGEAEEQEDEK